MNQFLPLDAKKTVKILNLGCSKNLVDSENILGEFGRAGFRQAGDEEEATVSIINTCGFIEAAKEESIQEVLAAIQAKSRIQRLVVAGCLSQRYMEELKKELPEVDLFVGTYKPGELLERMGLQSTQPSDCDFGANASATPRTLMSEENHHAHLKIAEGCNRICSFCAIPGMRGKQVSKPIARIVQEAQELESLGVREISLIAQDLTYFGREKGGTETLEQLLRALLKETGIPWIRLMYAYPAFLEDGLLQLMAEEKRICKYLDMPIQHASTAMLRAMRRNYTGEQLREQLLRLRSTVPGLRLRTTVLLGFPGETEADVEELLRLMEEVRFDRLGGFTYSDEEGTHAYTLESPRVPQEEMEERLERVMSLQREISLENNQRRIGQRLVVLVDRLAEGEDHRFVARTEGDAPEVDNQVLIYDGDADPGTFRTVLITDAREYDLEAVFDDTPMRASNASEV